jgi:hypothetical protein
VAIIIQGLLKVQKCVGENSVCKFAQEELGTSSEVGCMPAEGLHSSRITGIKSASYFET